MMILLTVAALLNTVLCDSSPSPDAQFSGERMDPDTSALDPGLLQAVLADPVLLQAVDPRVLQAVLVSAAQATRDIAFSAQNPPQGAPFGGSLPAAAPGQVQEAVPAVPEKIVDVEEFDGAPEFPERFPVEAREEEAAQAPLKTNNFNLEAFGSSDFLTPNPRTQQQRQFGNQQSQFGNQQSQFGNQQSQFGNQPSQFGIQQSQFGNQQAQFGNQQGFNFLQQNRGGKNLPQNGGFGTSFNQPQRGGFGSTQNPGFNQPSINGGFRPFNQQQNPGFRGAFPQNQNGDLGGPINLVQTGGGGSFQGSFQTPNQNRGLGSFPSPQSSQGAAFTQPGGAFSFRQQNGGGRATQNNGFGRSLNRPQSALLGPAVFGPQQQEEPGDVEDFGGGDFSPDTFLKLQQQHQQQVQQQQGPETRQQQFERLLEAESREEFGPSINHDLAPRANTDVELVARVGPGGQDLVARVGSLDPAEVARTLQANPEIAQELARQIQKDPSIAETLGLSAFLTHQNQILPPSPLFSAAPPGVCSLVTHNGHPCDPGLAFNPLTGSCEWPDTLLEVGCNPEVVTGFGPCPQDAGDPRLTPAQIASWPQPKFPVNLDVVTVQNFDAFLAKKFFVVCVPTVYGRLFPRLICCPDHTFFDPFHIDGCVYEHHHHPDEPHDIHHHTLPPPTFGSPDPFIKHVGAPLPIGGFIKKRSVRAASNGTSLDWKERLNEAAILIE